MLATVSEFLRDYLTVAIFAALAAGLWATRRVLDAPPAVTLRELQG